MKTRKILATIAAFIAVATVLSAAALAVSLQSTHTDVTPTIDTTTPENVILPAITASEEKAALPDISRSEPVHEHYQALGGLAWMRAIDAQMEEYHLAEVARLECTHEDSIAYIDTDTGISSAYCMLCGATIILAQAPACAMVTNAINRDICVHEYTDWNYYDSANHTKICTKCMKTVYEAHSIVRADCTTFEHCSVCGGRDSSWESASGHIMAYVIDWDYLDANNGYDNADNYYHIYRCIRDDNDCQYVCDYIPFRENCTFDDLFWDAESDGMHEMYYRCPMCEVPYFIEPEICYFATLGYNCYRCNNPHPGY